MKPGRAESLLAASRTLPIVGRAAVLALVIGAVAVLLQLPGLISALLMPRPEGVESAPAADPQRVTSMASRVSQTDGRTMFFVPGPPPPPPPVVAVEEKREPPPPPPPATYGGPAIIAAANEFVWFADGTRSKVGDEAAPVKVLRIESPWTIAVLWKGVEFKVDIFDRDKVVIKDSVAPTDQPKRSNDDGGVSDGKSDRSRPSDESEAP
ncbi:MAG: hypothetical protein JNM07_05275 [Phycisphaerae bacterium]|nr:hypothetical protein [Phycisphaerae bacterium]